MGIIVLVVVAVAIVAMAVVFFVKKSKEGKVETKPKEEPEEPSVVQEPSKPEKSVCEGCNNFEACIDCENGSRWAHIQEPVVEPEKPKEKHQNPNVDDDKADPFIPLEYLDPFKEIVDIKVGTKTCNYLTALYYEACAQYGGQSQNGLPILFKEESFPQIYNFYGDNGSEDAAFKTLVGWLLAMQLAELRPQDRTEIFKIGYELGGYTKDSALYGWKFRCDPNICRLVAAAIWSAMRGVCKPDIEAMREECDYFCWNETIEEIRMGDDPFYAKEDGFYIDLREFLPTAPGPYAPNYKDRSAIGGYPYPNDAKTDDYNLTIDRAIRDMVVEKYNLNEDYKISSDNMEKSFSDYCKIMRTVQAIADKDANYNHLFGKERQVGSYHFNPVFTSKTLGQEVYPSLAKELCSLVDDVLNIGSSQRCILQGHEGQENPPQYGRLRPGCSWQVEAHRHSDTDDTQNVLVDFYIEDGDGNPTGYYNKDGEWVDKEGIHSPEEYNDVMKDELWANSYPSGHSAAISSTALLLIELLPKQADKIMAAANRFAVNRTIARYHWNSDTIQGRVLATCIAPIIRCCSDWNERFEKAKNCLK